VFEIDCAFKRDNTPTYNRKESPESWRNFREVLDGIDIMNSMLDFVEGLTSQERVNGMSNMIVYILTYAYQLVTPLVKYKPPPIGGFLTRETLRHLAHAKRLYRSLVRTVEDESKPYVKAKLKVINKANRWRIKKDRERWELKRLHLCKNRGTNFYKFMKDATQTTSKIGPY
jgi:hypothetical protein